MTSEEHIQWITEIVEEVNRNEVMGDLVECGVWKGGCSLAMMLAQNKFEEPRDIYLYDSFEGFANVTCTEEEFKSASKIDSALCYCSLKELKQNLSVAQYPEDKTHYVKGDVCQTLDGTTPDSISILRLDTDFYESTKKELEILAPKVSTGGYVIIDDYWAFPGCRRATLDWYKENASDFQCITPGNGREARKKYRKAFTKTS